MIYTRHKTPIGVKVEEISGGDGFSPRVWRLMAGQVWSENGKNGYRALDHYPDGAPYSEPDERISVTHTERTLLVASLPRTPEEKDLSHFSPRAALGIDAERCDRTQCLKVRNKYLSSTEQQMIPADEVEQNILAWTIKEAVYKAMLTPGLPLIDGIEITKLPQIQPENTDKLPSTALGEAIVHLNNAECRMQNAECGMQNAECDVNNNNPNNNTPITFLLYCYRLGDLIVTLAIMPATSTYRKALQ